LDNQFSHTPSGTSCTITVAKGERDVTIVIADRGPGFATLDVMARGKSTAGSTGLGLDIAQAAISHAGGELTFANNPKGGATFSIRLPLIEQEATALSHAG
jgi:K+-sensing histidine kinase KdpD